MKAGTSPLYLRIYSEQCPSDTRLTRNKYLLKPELFTCFLPVVRRARSLRKVSLRRRDASNTGTRRNAGGGRGEEPHGFIKPGFALTTRHHVTFVSLTALLRKDPRCPKVSKQLQRQLRASLEHATSRRTQTAFRRARM